MIKNIILLTAAVGIVMVTTPTAASAESSSWHPQEITLPGALTAVAADQSADPVAWAFGIRPDGVTFAVRTVGPFADEWERADVPDVGRVAGSRGAWAAGERGALHRVDGVWRRVPMAGTRTSVRAIEADPLDGNVAWAVGAERVGTQQRGAVQRWDGTRWFPVAVPPAVLDSSSELTGVLPEEHGAVFFGVDHDPSGDRLVALRLDGATWTRIATAPRVGHDEHVSAFDPMTRRLVGWTAPVGAPCSARTPLVYRWEDGDQAHRDAVPAVAAELTGATTEYGTPIAVGFTAAGQPFAMRVNDFAEFRWAADPMPEFARGRLLAVAGFISPNIWAVGVIDSPSGQRPLVLRDIQ